MDEITNETTGDSSLAKTVEYNTLLEAVDSFDISKYMSDEEFEEGLITLAALLLFGTEYFPDRIRNKKILKKIPTLQDIPLLCKGDSCPYAPVCPVIRNLTSEQKKELEGKSCRDEQIYGIELFARLTKELSIEPEHTIDLMTATALVRDWILKRRYDRQIAIDGMMSEEPSVVDQRSGHVFWRDVVHPLHKLSETLDKQIKEKLSSLMASRKDRAALAAAMGKQDDLIRALFSGKFARGPWRPESVPLSEQEAINAEFSQPEEEDEEE